MSYISAWATFTSTFPSVDNDVHYASMTRIHTYNADHHLRTPESPQQHRYPQPGGRGPYVWGQVKVDDGYEQLQRLVKLREAKLADCSYLNRQRRKPVLNGVTAEKRGSPAQAAFSSTPRAINPSQEVVGDVKATNQPEHKTSKAQAGWKNGLGYMFQGEKPAKLLSSPVLEGFNSSWGRPYVTETTNKKFGANDSPFRFHWSQVSQADYYRSDDSTTDSESESLSSWGEFTWSFPISREQNREGVRYSDYRFDENGRLQGLENSLVAIVLTMPSDPAPKWRPPPNDPAYRPRCKSLLHPNWKAKN
ncbi:hypothetical protein FRC01_002500 [Tulasnella sp. 417]|nr:hypothetical protein FRC01_002500 [Tulasnella sp. 417]